MHAESLFIVQSVILIGLPVIIWKIRSVQWCIPLVVIQILLGIIMGPSILGVLMPTAEESLFPVESLQHIKGLAWTALLFFGLLTGLHFDTDEIRGKGRSFIAISMSSIVLPSVMGVMAAAMLLSMYPSLAGEHATNATFLLAIGLAAGVTALPVLGAILYELKLINKPIGKLALGMATVNDGMLWIGVCILLAMAGNSGGGSMDAVRTITLTLIYGATMWFGISKALEWAIQRKYLCEKCTNNQLVMLCCGMFLSALCTELIGVHYLLGAFVFGAVVAKTSKKIAHAIQHRLEPFVMVVLIPYFFMLTGLRTKFEVGSQEVWVVFTVMTAVSALGKFVGTAVPARLSGCSLKKSAVLGSFMQCKGLMEVVVLTMMLQAKIISASAFSGMILMAVATTAATIPFVKMCKSLPNGDMNDEILVAPEAEAAVTPVLVPEMV